ncbi:hypothetical protein ACIO6T_34225 [Streptomyces sp. NPDC087532]|uniref:hypothetical protein n=1 Tax=unclassified Streptomyces TaxID=2593676 RepID=UPI003329E815
MDISGERSGDKKGQIFVTRFECQSLFRLLLVLGLHVKVKREVRRAAEGFLGGTTLVQWRRRTVLSISLWQDLDSVYSMGRVGHHIVASRMPARTGIRTACGVYPYAGDWKHVMFGAPATAGEPLFATGSVSTTGKGSPS